MADGRTVRTFHVVGVDFKLRLGVNLRVVGKQQVAVGLLGVGLLRVFVNNDASVKNAMRVAVQNPVVKLATAAVRAGMLDVHVVVEMLPPITDKEPVDQTLAAFSRQHRMHVVANQSASEQQRVRSHVGAALLLNAQSRNVESI